LKFASSFDVKLTGGFMKERERLNSTVTIKSVYDRFSDTGRIDAFSCSWHEGDPNKPHIFWDSDVAKWMESAAYILRDEERPDLEKEVEHLIDEIEKHQCDDGYFNIYFQTIDPSHRFTHIGLHELYCCGHLIEAAVAYYECTGKDRFLKLMCKYADLVEKVFKIERSARFSVPGHEEIELAIVRLYHATKEKRYLELAKFFVDERGKNPQSIDENNYPPTNTQDHLPAREQRKAYGHCVRAVYFYSAMADIALEYNDKDLYDACRELFEDITKRKMYITGGIGSTYLGESFTIPYDLPTLQAYTESCAAIGLCLFAHRMQLLDSSSEYADVIERILYNGFLSSTSLDGKAFFYENPLEVHPKLKNRNTSTVHKDRFPITQRLEVFSCSCCPPNITRFIPSLGDYIFTYDDKTLFVQQFMSCKGSFDGTNIEIITDYPISGDVKILINDTDFGMIAIRKPMWCKNIKVKSGKVSKDSGGYIYFDVKETSVIELNFDMTPYFVECSAYINDVAGKSALCRGPVVYCMEGVDNGETLSDIRILRDSEITVTDGKLTRIPELEAKAVKKIEETLGGSLYARSDEVRYENTVAKFIPYFAFANRGESDMAIFFAVK